ncbi:hypothetical protein [Actinomadura macra]|uniref:hypothetical protein n=1 Tax=Actinomadura macra TaxID=46164 RepID=UPI00083018AC|nr:hypothetical protein [Actinomadura macra]
MRFLIILALLAVAAVVVVLLLYAFGGLAPDGRRRPGPSARWETHTEASGGATAVVVRQVTRDASGGLLDELGRQTVATIPDGDPDWDTRYHEAMAEARSRVAALEVESG